MAKQKASAKKSPIKKKASPKKSAAKKNLKKASLPIAKKKVPAKKTVVKKKKENLMCFLTTACVNHYGLADDCVQLQTLRNYRDAYLMQTPAGKALVQEYYRVSPQIIVEIKEAKHQNEDYAFIYDQITEGVKQISQEANEAARITYTNMVKKLARKYDLEIKEAEKKQ
jgi:nitrate reductase alpha subunit